MLAKLHTFRLLGIDALPLEVEVDASPGAVPKTVLVGLPEQAVKASLHRIERAMVKSGFVQPQDRVVIEAGRHGRRGERTHLLTFWSITADYDGRNSPSACN